MNKRTLRFRAIMRLMSGAMGACAVSPAFAATSMTPEQWSSYLLFGSIALLVAGVVAKMLRYSSRTGGEALDKSNDDGTLTIGAYRNRVLSPSR
jgi:uncharacterized membrane protein YgdD (TMEM256/DUF423 family)